MYLFKKELKKQLLQGRTIKYVASKIGITSAFLSSVLCGNRTCSKLTAYCITKYFGENYEVNDLFIRKGE